ncbi:hypothetical protein R1flu_017295, partial [Riccia fluitans]
MDWCRFRYKSTEMSSVKISCRGISQCGRGGIANHERETVGQTVQRSGKITEEQLTTRDLRGISSHAVRKEAECGAMSDVSKVNAAKLKRCR